MKVSIALCVMYAIALLIEIYGIIGVSMVNITFSFCCLITDCIMFTATTKPC